MLAEAASPDALQAQPGQQPRDVPALAACLPAQRESRAVVLVPQVELQAQWGESVLARVVAPQALRQQAQSQEPAPELS